MESLVAKASNIHGVRLVGVLLLFFTDGVKSFQGGALLVPNFSGLVAVVTQVKCFLCFSM